MTDHYRLTVFVSAQDRLSTKLRAAQTNNAPVPQLLWDEQQYDALGWPPLDYDPEREREAMQHYYKAVTDDSLYRATQRGRKRGGPCK